MKTSLAGAIALAALAATGCVSQGKYDQAVAQTATTRAELARKAAAYDQVSAKLAQQTAARAQAAADLARKAAALEAASADLEARRKEISKLKGELDALAVASADSRTASGARITALQARLVELQAAQSAAEARASLYKDLSFRLKSQIDDGDLQLVVRDGRMVLQLPNDVLFDTGRTELKPAGKKALEAVADVMRSMPHRSFQVAGHTDDVPIRNETFASNWELSSGRALRVVHFLVDRGVPPAMLSAAGYGEVDPVAPNATAAGKRMNRRTEITLQPNIDELVKLPQ